MEDAMSKPTLKEFKLWIEARQTDAAKAIIDAPSGQIKEHYSQFARASAVIREIEAFTDELDRKS